MKNFAKTQIARHGRAGTIFLLALLPFFAGTTETFAQAALPQQQSRARGQQAQQAQQSQQQAQTSPAQSNNFGTVAGGDYRSSTISEQSNKIFDVDNDMIDPGAGMMKWKGKIFQVEDAKIFRERFERYLSTPPPEEAQGEYTKILRKIQKLLAQQDIPRAQVNDKMIEAMHLLIDASKFDADESQSLTLANQVYKACRQRAELNELMAWQRALEAEKKKLQDQFSNRDNIRRSEERSLSSRKKDGSKTTTKVEKAPSAQQTFITQRIAENKASMTKASTQRESMETQAKLEFQSTMASFLAARHYGHALLASAFYRVLFRGGQHGLDVGKSEFLEEVNISKMVPSLETFDQIAREMQSEVSKCMRAVESNWNAGQKYSAMRQLIYAYMLGEHELSVIYYPEEKKSQFFRMWLDLREVARQSENRDLGEIELTLARIKAFAPDFPSAEITGKVEAAKRASNMSIMRARQAALAAGMAGTPEAMTAATEEIERHLTTAAEYWPQNPGLTEFMQEVLNKADVLAQLAPEFDRLVAQKKSREIYNRRAEFTAALMQDASRRQRFEEIIAHVTELETALTQVNMLIARHDDYIAWDTLLLAENIDPDDEAVIKKKSELAPLVSTYSRLIVQAKQDEGEGDMASALNKYLAAQDINPASEICRTAIAHAADTILRKITPADTMFVPKPKEPPVANDKDDSDSDDDSDLPANKAGKSDADSASADGDDWDF